MTDDGNIEMAPGETPAPATLIDIVFPGDTNHHGTLFGGAGLALMDRIAFIVATRHGRVPFVTASRRLLRARPHRHIVSFTGRPMKVGRRSMVVEVDMIAEDLIEGAQAICAPAASSPWWRCPKASTPAGRCLRSTPPQSVRQKTTPCAWSISSFLTRPTASAPCSAATRWRR
ncbi:acyl-CoA thioesterase [Ensifer canadensis]